ncbi:MAG TPA: hypothetical protein VMZ50_00600 [Phycisphaerae bacterium]|nr:hypothetical protein [Phycisphaerae bacterium]
MLGGTLIVIGLVVMLFGVLMLAGWTSGKSRWFGAEVYDRAGNTKTDRMFLHLYFVTKVLLPLLLGATLLVYGLRQALRNGG